MLGVFGGVGGYGGFLGGGGGGVGGLLHGASCAGGLSLFLMLVANSPASGFGGSGGVVGLVVMGGNLGVMGSNGVAA